MESISISRGIYIEKDEPSPIVDFTEILPPKSSVNSLDMLRPRPVPPCCLLVPPSACLKASKIKNMLLSSIPIPLSITEITIGLSFLSSSVFSVNSIDMLPSLSVNLIALDMKFLSICVSFDLSLEKAINAFASIIDSS